MTVNEIKKELYKKKPLARIHQEHPYHYHYCAHLNGVVIDFHVPIADMGDKRFDDEIPAQLLIRYIAP